jgi:NADPH:quinone reductase-like Zn-dependent oxidoreductase
MQALVRARYGTPDELEVREVARPVPQDSQVLVRVHACSINDWDWGLLREPTVPIRRDVVRPVILGSDVAGRIEAVGKSIQRFRVGDAVYGDLCGRGGWGGFAEYVCATENRLTPKPSRMSFEQAAALPQAGQLAAQALLAGGPLRDGQRILINGAGGGVGTIGVQLAKQREVEVTGVDNAAKLEMMRRIGFDHVIDYRQEDFASGRRQYDLIIDTKTSRSPFAHARALAPNGTYATVGGESMKLLLKTLIAGPWIRLTRRRRVGLIALRPNRDMRYLNECFEAGKLVPVIDGPYSLADSREAFRRFGAGDHLGKIVITID